MLVLNIEPGEKIAIGGALVSYDPKSSRLYVEGEVPILRSKDLLREEQINTMCKDYYFTIQKMYTQQPSTLLTEKYHVLCREMLARHPHWANMLDTVQACIIAKRFYQAMKIARKLVEEEETFFATPKHAG